MKKNMDNSFERSRDSLGTDNLSNLRSIAWTDKGKKTLLDALKKYGYTDIQNISEKLPNKSQSALRTMINKLRLAAKKCTTRRSDQIDVWLNSGLFNECDNVIPQALKFISIFEKHPSPNHSAGCNFKTLYDILSQVTHGVPPVDISQKECEALSYIFTGITHGVWPVDTDNICQFVDNLERNKTKKCYPPKRRS